MAIAAAVLGDHHALHIAHGATAAKPHRFGLECRVVIAPYGRQGQVPNNNFSLVPGTQKAPETGSRKGALL